MYVTYVTYVTYVPVRARTREKLNRFVNSCKYLDFCRRDVIHVPPASQPGASFRIESSARTRDNDAFHTFVTRAKVSVSGNAGGGKRM